MGSRSSAKTVTQLLFAFRDQDTWTQVELARRCGITVKALRVHLLTLKDAGMPLHDEPEPPHVMWSVPRGYYPGGALFDEEQLDLITRLVARGASSAGREKLLRRLVRFSKQALVRNVRLLGVREPVLDVLERGAADKVVCAVRYVSAHRAIVEEHTVSVHVIDHGERVRFVASSDGALRWFRADAVESAALEPTGAYREVEQAVLDRFLGESVDGFHGGGDATPYEFFVRMPEARWVARNLPLPLRVESVPNGVLVRGRTTALKVIAARVVGYGGAAEALSAELRSEVTKLARAALGASERSVRKGNVQAVGSKRRTG